MAKRVTIAEVAKVAGVSTATVSYILNRTPGHRFAEETVQRVTEAVERLQYDRSSALKKLRTGEASKGLICLAYAPNSERVHQTARGSGDELQSAGYDVVQIRLELEQAKENAVPLYNQRLTDVMDGIIFLQAGGLSLKEQWASLVIERRIPFVTTDCQWSRDISSVEFNYLDGAYQLTKRLLQNHIQRIYHFYMPYEMAPQIREQMQGVRRAVYECEWPVEIIELVDPLFVEKRASDPVKLLQSAMPQLDAQTAILFGYHDHNQYALRLCMERGLEIPIGALEQGALDANVFPQLHYSVLPLYEMGVAAAKALIRQLNRPKDITHEVLRPTLMP